MLRRVDLKSWKSFEEASLNVDRLTVLIGANASGKSNALDALEFLSRAAAGIELGPALSGNASIAGIRGELDWATHSGSESFSLTAVVGSDDPKTDYEYRIEVEVLSGVAELRGEQLTRVKYQGNNPRPLKLFWTDEPELEAPGITARLYNRKSGTKRPLRRNASILSQLEFGLDVRDEIDIGVQCVLSALKSIFILDPNPSAMRGFSRLYESLFKDGSNLAGVLMALPESDRLKIETKLTELAKQIPEKDILRVWTEFVGRHRSDAMLYCEEAWEDRNTFEVDARGMSDGTLRFIAVVATLLLRPRGSTVVIEEIDNGLHPSRAIALLEAISSISEEREIELILTTHNVALLNSLPPELIRSISVASRTSRNGSSKIIALDDLPLLASVIAEGEVGSLSQSGRLVDQILELTEDA